MRLLQIVLVCLCILVLVCVAVWKGREGGGEGFKEGYVEATATAAAGMNKNEILNDVGDTAFDDACAVKTSAGGVHLMNGYPYLGRHPNSANECLFRTSAYESLIMSPTTLEQCNAQTPYLSDAAGRSVRNVEVRQVGGVDRCVVSFHPGMDETVYTAYEKSAREATLKLTPAYKKLEAEHAWLLAEKERLKTEIEQLEEELKKVRAERAVLEDENGKAQQEAAAAQAEHDALAGERDALDAAIKEAEDDIRLFALGRAHASKINSLGQAAFDLGKFGMWPWGKDAQFPDPSARWIWSSPGAAQDAPVGQVQTFAHAFVLRHALRVRIHAIVDNIGSLWVNGTDLGPIHSDWGRAYGYSTTVVNLVKGVNVIAATGMNAGSSAGIIVTVIDEANGQRVVSSNGAWRWDAHLQTFALPLPTL